MIFNLVHTLFGLFKIKIRSVCTPPALLVRILSDSLSQPRQLQACKLVVFTPLPHTNKAYKFGLQSNLDFKLLTDTNTCPSKLE
jgi:hypothetical protein